MTIDGPSTVRATAEFESARSRLLGVAHQVVGRAADAEDVVQDVWVRWQTADHATVRSPIAFLVTVTRRLALNAAASAYARREVSAGEWLSDFVLAVDDPARDAERGDVLEVAVQFLMERLAPAECAVYLLREAFDYPFREIAGALDISEANARQLATRARRHLREDRRGPVDQTERDGLLRAFADAARRGETGRLVDHLSRWRGPR
ncbi:sigma-70 family RNA polymerase sigma factor [Actinoplanes hulinensis]|uniref:Sigma-70 family RNA polymerase sigma factor n=1 Tax=Actinoplanes hulinensis TaxID=1144547 RepID=A0ABS7AXK4_9ACTN|nr:sigma-70 family RNA polymerase sigma factor [Actinoplanes hulinensis]MBW6433499.1 sigma-70 family RNA polymerase sigma factor [Actinoplanes hulinensis]